MFSDLVALLGRAFPLRVSKNQALLLLGMMVTPVVTVVLQGLSRSATAAIELLGNAFAGTVVNDRFSAYNHLHTRQRQLRPTHLQRDLVAIAERPGVSGQIGAELLELQQQLFGRARPRAGWHCREGVS